MTLQADIEHRLRGHSCHSGCDDLLCRAAREIEDLRALCGLVILKCSSFTHHVSDQHLPKAPCSVAVRFLAAREAST